MDRRGFIKVSGWTALGLAATGSILSCARTPGKDLKRLPNEARKLGRHTQSLQRNIRTR